MGVIYLDVRSAGLLSKKVGGNEESVSVYLEAGDPSIWNEVSFSLSSLLIIFFLYTLDFGHRYEGGSWVTSMAERARTCLSRYILSMVCTYVPK